MAARVRREASAADQQVIGSSPITMKDFIGAVTGKGGAIDAIHRLNDTQFAPKHIKVYRDEESGDAIPMARGGDFLVTGSTLFLAGEAAAERAS